MTGVFDKYYKEYDAWYDRNKFVYLSELKALEKVVPRKGRGLEIGVGTGRFAGALGIRFGIDLSVKMLKVAKSRGIKTKIGKGEDLPFAGSSFDYVAIINTLCFVKDPVQVVAQAKRVLKKSGKLIVGIIDKDSFLGRLYRKKKSIFYLKAHFFSVKEITSLLSSSGFKRISCLQTLFSLPEDIASVHKPRIGFGKGGFVVISGVKRG